MDRAQRIINQAEHEASLYLPGSADADRARLNFHIGLLQGQVRKLCAELESYGPPEGDGHYTVVQVEHQGYTVDVLVDDEGLIESAWLNGIDLLPLMDDIGLQSKVSEMRERLLRESREQAIDDARELERRYA